MATPASVSDLKAERTLPRAERHRTGSDRNFGGMRSPYERDRDRVLYSSAFRRLAGIAQVVAVHERRLLHTRLTHSLKVAQVGRRIAERLLVKDEALGHPGNDLNADVVEAACLAHDLGHPPFGHAAEYAINGLTKNSGLGFEGNAQSFRIVTKLSVRRMDDEGEVIPGLDLTRCSLDAILKYPRFGPSEKVKINPWVNRSFGEKWGVYKSDYKDFEFARPNDSFDLKTDDKSRRVRSINAIVMDWADDISFATHDLEDFVDAGLIVPRDLNEGCEGNLFREFALEDMKSDLALGFKGDAFDKAYGRVVSAWSALSKGYSGSRVDQARLHQTIVDFIRAFDSACRISNSKTGVTVGVGAQYEVEILKRLVRFYAIQHPGVTIAEHGQKKLIVELFGLLYQMLISTKSPRAIPMALHEIHLLCTQEADDFTPEKMSKEDFAAFQAVQDYLCSLTEDQVFDLFERMTGLSRASIFGAWFR